MSNRKVDTSAYDIINMHTISLLSAVMLFLAFMSSLPLAAAPTAPAPYCEITGKIVEVRQVRKETAGSQSWRQEWGQPDHKTYTNVQIRVKSARAFAYQEGGFDGETARKRCNADDVPREAVYQACSSPVNKKWEGVRIWGVTHFSGDEFGVHDCLKSVINITNLDQLGE